MRPFYIFSLMLATLANVAPALAADQGSLRTSPLTGPYVGIYGGYDWTDTDTLAGLKSDPDGWDGGVFAGYKMDALLGEGMRNYGIGANGAIEAFYGVSNADDTVDGITVSKNDEWGVSFRPGLSVLDRITGNLGLNPYAILGYRNTEFETSAFGIKNAERYNGFELGIGTQLVAFGNAGIRLEYSHIWYGSKGGVDPDSDDLRLGVSYHF